MFDKKELSIILRSLEASRNTIKISCVFCELVDDNEQYTHTKYCVENCDVCKDIGEIDSLVLKIKEALI